MIKIENTEVMGWEAAIRGMRNPMNSWEKSDSCTQGSVWCDEFCGASPKEIGCDGESGLYLGPNDHELMMKLANGGPVHAKYRRMITVYCDITAPLYWWKEFDTYKVGTVANSCSTMHKIHAKEFMLDDFSHEHLIGRDYDAQMTCEIVDGQVVINDCSPKDCLQLTCNILNFYRDEFLAKSKEFDRADLTDAERKHSTAQKKLFWNQMIQLLPSSYNQKRTVMMNYEVLHNIYISRKNHKLDEWSVGFIDWIKTLPYSELIVGEEQ